MNTNVTFTRREIVEMDIDLSLIILALETLKEQNQQEDNKSVREERDERIVNLIKSIRTRLCEYK